MYFLKSVNYYTSIFMRFITGITFFNFKVTIIGLIRKVRDRLSGSSFTHLYDAKDLIIAQMFSLTVDQEVIELRDGQSQHTQR